MMMKTYCNNSLVEILHSLCIQTLITIHAFCYVYTCSYQVCVFLSFVAPICDDTLTPNDAVNIREEILEAQNQSRLLGLKLNVPEYIVTGIHTYYMDPKERLYYVLLEFLKQVHPRPTWRAIISALKSPSVNLPQLAMKVEAAHFPVPTTTYDVPLETTMPTGKYIPL